MTRALAFIAIFAAAPAAAFDLSDHAPQETVAGWTIHCEEFDDMGGITLLNCVVARDGVILSNLAGTIAASGPAGARLAGVEAALTPAPRPIPGGRAALAGDADLTAAIDAAIAMED